MCVPDSNVGFLISFLYIMWSYAKQIFQLLFSFVRYTLEK